MVSRLKESTFNWGEYWDLFEKGEDGLPVITELDASPDSVPPLSDHLKKKYPSLAKLIEDQNKEEVFA